MNDRGIMRVSKDQLAEMNDETDWARVAAMTEADIERAAAEDPDASLTTAGDWKDARVVWPQTTEPVTLRLDRDVLAWFRRQGRGYQARINAVLRALVKAQGASRPVPSSGSGTTARLVPVRGGDLELHLVARRHRAVTDVVADEQRLPAGAHPPAAGGGVAVAAHNCTPHLAVDGADKGPRHGQSLRDRGALVDEPPRPP